MKSVQAMALWLLLVLAFIMWVMDLSVQDVVGITVEYMKGVT